MRAIGALFTLVFPALILGVLIGFSLAAPLGGDMLGGVLGLTGGIAGYALLWRALPRWARRVLAVLPILALIGGGIFAYTQLYDLGMVAPSDDYMDAYHRLYRALYNHYPYFEQKGVDWVANYRPHAATMFEIVQRGDEAAYFRAIADLLASLNDGHTALSDPYTQVERWFGRATHIEGQAVLTTLTETAEANGLRVGDVLLSVNGVLTEQAWRALPPDLRVGSTEWNQRGNAYQFLLALTPSTPTLTLEVRGADGGTRQITLDMATPDQDSAAPQPAISSQRLPSGIGYIRVARLWEREHEDLIADFDAALAALSDAPAIILDLRRNGGGNSRFADQIAGRFLAEPFSYGRDVFRQRTPNHFWRAESVYTVTPHAKRYNGKLAVLIDERSVSSAEWLIAALADSGRAQTVGRTTAGSSGNPISFPLPNGGAVRFSTGAFYRTNGQLLEGIGIAPDLPITWTLEDVRNGRDPDLAAAERLLSGAP